MAAQQPPSSASGSARSPTRINTSPYEQHPQQQQQYYASDSTATRRYAKSESHILILADSQTDTLLLATDRSTVLSLRLQFDLLQPREQAILPTTASGTQISYLIPFTDNGVENELIPATTVSLPL